MGILTKEQTKEVFDKKFNEGDGDAIKRFQDAMRESSREFIEHFPMWMKFNFIANTTADKTDEEIDWNYVNEMLLKNAEDDDYNCFDRINSKEEFKVEYDKIVSAQFDMHPFRRCTCKTCKEPFTLNFSEIEYYKSKELKLPKRCIYCRKGIEKPKPIVEVKKAEVPEEPVKTAMQIALEKAGIN